VKKRIAFLIAALLALSGFGLGGGLSRYLSKNVAINLESGLRASYRGVLFKI
jgi:hypothetical protein